MRIGRSVIGEDIVLDGVCPGYAPHLHLPRCDRPVQRAALAAVLDDAIRSGRSVVSLFTDSAARTALLRLAEEAGRSSDVVEIRGDGGEGHPYTSALQLHHTDIVGQLQSVLAEACEVGSPVRTILHVVENYLSWRRSSGHAACHIEELATLVSLEGLRFMARRGSDEAPGHVTSFARRYVSGVDGGGFDFGGGLVATREWHEALVERVAHTLRRMTGFMRATHTGLDMDGVFQRGLICIVHQMPPEIAAFVHADLDFAVSALQRHPDGAKAHMGGVVVLRDASWIPSRHGSSRFENDCAASGISLVMPTRDDVLPDMFGPTDNRTRTLPIPRLRPLPMGIAALTFGSWRYRRISAFASKRSPAIVMKTKLLRVKEPRQGKQT